jgi:elongation factor G
VLESTVTHVSCPQTIISGMGELHLEIYRERMRREYNCPTVADRPRVAFRETVGKEVPFDYLHKKQSGGSGQYGRVIGKLRPVNNHENPEDMFKNLFTNNLIGNNIPPNFVPSIQKGFNDSCTKGPLIGYPIMGCVASTVVAQC